MAKNVDPKAKEKRQKVILAVGGVILLGLLGFQLPRTLKMLHPQTTTTSASSSATITQSPGASSLAPPSLDGGGGGVTTTGASGDVSDPLAKVTPASGQLVRFAAPRFKGHDPFVQQVDEGQGVGPNGGASTTTTTTTGSRSGSSGSGSGSASSDGGSTSTAPVVPPPSTSGGGSTAPSGAKVTVATISVNGVAEKVRVGATFPKADPVFQLVSLASTSAKIAIAGGSYTSGQQTVTLMKGTQLTLMNTANGRQYVLRLLAAE